MLLLVAPVALVLAASPGEVLRYLGDEEAREAIRLSLLTSLTATGIVILFGTPLAFGLARAHFKGRSLLETLVDLDRRVKKNGFAEDKVKK